MFSLVITVISIALVAALALATLFYGGAAFNKGSADAEASKVVLQGQQLLGAADFYFAENNQWPTMAELLADAKYLKSVPVAQREAMAAAVAADVPWTMPTDRVPLFKLEGALAQEACAAVNLKGSLSKRGILRQAYPQLNAQCFGEGTSGNPYRVIFKKFGTLDGAGLTPGEIGTGEVPTDPDDPAWSTPPGTTTGGGAGGGDTPTETNGGNGLHLSQTIFDFGERGIGGWGAITVIATNNTANPITFNHPNWDTDEWFYGPNTNQGTGLDSWLAEFYLQIDREWDCDPLPAGASCEMYAEFQPAEVGERTWSTTLNTSVGNFPLYFRGTGVAASLLARSLDMGDVPMGTNRKFVSTFANPFGRTMNFVSLTTSVPGLELAQMGDTIDWYGTPYTFGTDWGATDWCEINEAPANGYCVNYFFFTPQAVGPVSGTYTLTMEDDMGDIHTETGTVTGQVTAPPLPGGLDVTPATMTFPNVIVGQSAWVTPQVTNNTGQPVTLSGVSVNNAVFTTTLAGNPPGCDQLSGGVLANGASCYFAVEFKPTAAGTQTGQVVISGTAYGESFVGGVSVTGTGTAPPAQPWINDPLSGDANTMLVYGPHRTLEGHAWNHTWNGNWSGLQLNGSGAANYYPDAPVGPDRWNNDNFGGRYAEGVVDTPLPGADYFVEVTFDFTDVNNEDAEDHGVYVFGRIRDYEHDASNPFWGGYLDSTYLSDVYFYPKTYSTQINNYTAMVTFGEQGGGAVPYTAPTRSVALTTGRHVLRVEYFGTQGQVLVNGMLAASFTLNDAGAPGTLAGMGAYNPGYWDPTVNIAYFRVGPITQLSAAASMPAAAVLPPPPPPPESVNEPIYVDSYKPADLGTNVFVSAPGWYQVGGDQVYYPNGRPYVNGVRALGGGGSNTTTIAGPQYVTVENTSTANAYYTYAASCNQSMISTRNSCQTNYLRTQGGYSSCQVTNGVPSSGYATRFQTVCTK